jgi:hypothetical protein
MYKFISVEPLLLIWGASSVFFQPPVYDVIAERLARSTVAVVQTGRLSLLQINHFFSATDSLSARRYFESIPLDTRIFTTANALGGPVASDNPSYSFSYDVGTSLLEKSESFIGQINAFLGWLGEQTQSDIQLYTSSESRKNRQPYADSAFICNKLFTISDQAAKASIHHDYPYVQGSGDVDCYYNFTMTIFITSEGFDDPGFGTQFIPLQDKPAIVVPCHHMQLSIFNGDVPHGFCASKTTVHDPDSWRASVTWKCRATPRQAGISLKDRFVAVLCDSKVCLRLRTLYCPQLRNSLN